MKANVKGKLRIMKKNLSKHSPLIMTGIGITASVTAVVTAFKAAPKAKKILKDIDETTSPDATKKEILWEKTKALAPLVAPVVLAEGVAIGCMLGAYKVNNKRLVALGTAYSLSEQRFKDYHDHVIKTLGEKKEQKIRDEIAAEKVKEGPGSEVFLADGNVLCYDTVSGRYFQSTIDKIEKAVNELNKRMINGEMYISLNDFYDEIGLPTITIGDDMGWNTDELLDVDFSTQLTDNNVPCVVVDYFLQPRFDYRNLH